MPQKLILFSLLLALLAVPLTSFGQDQKLAQQYFADGDYERALVLFKKLVETTQGNTYFMERYVDCLFQLKRWKQSKQTKKTNKEKKENKQRKQTNKERKKTNKESKQTNPEALCSCA